MRWTMAFVALAAVPATAQTVDSAVYLELGGQGETRIQPATRLMRGDRVVTILTWDVPSGGSYTMTSRVPSGLDLESATHPGVEVSTDGGITWRRPAHLDSIPRGTTHLRWPASGDGRLSYRAVVR